MKVQEKGFPPLSRDKVPGLVRSSKLPRCLEFPSSSGQRLRHRILWHREVLLEEPFFPNPSPNRFLWNLVSCLTLQFNNHPTLTQLLLKLHPFAIHGWAL